MGDRQYWLQTLGCPKNQVDSDKLVGVLAEDGYVAAVGPGDADLVVVNTCAFIEEARQESIDTVLSLASARRPGARLVVTGCMAERYGAELAEALPEVDLVAGFGVALSEHQEPSVDRGPGVTVPVALRGAPQSEAARAFDLLELARPVADRPWAYVKVAEGCDRLCGFCAIPTFRGLQRSRPVERVLEEVELLAAGGVREVVLVAQDLASYGRDRRVSGAATASDDAPTDAPIVSLTRAVAERVPRVRLLYLYPSGLTDTLVGAVLDTGVPYFDLSLQHVSRPHLRRMRRWGDGTRFLCRIEEIRERNPDATFRSSFILGYPGETEEDHDAVAGVPERRPARLGGVLHVLARRAPMPTGSATRCRTIWRSSVCASAPTCRTPSPPGVETRWWGVATRCWSMRRAPHAPCTRRPRSTAWWTCLGPWHRAVWWTW